PHPTPTLFPYTTLFRSNPDEIHGINSRSQLAFSESIMRDRINSFHMENGVTLINPENTYIEKDVEIGNDTVIYPGVNLEKGTKIDRKSTRLNSSHVSIS